MARILLASDDVSLSGPMSAQLMLLGHDVDVADSGALAVERARAIEYDLILSEARTPNVDALAFLEAVARRIENVTPFVVLAGFHDVGRVLSAMRAGAAGLIRKPWDVKDLLIAVNQSLTRRAEMKFRRDYQADLERRICVATAELKSGIDSIVGGFAMLLQARDASTAEHCIRVRDMSVRLGKEMNLSPAQLFELELAAALHDLGKVKIPDAILKKPGPLTPEERSEMQKHAEYGAAILKSVGAPEGASRAVLHHHERWDGSGYPEGLRGEAIPIAARIISVASAYDAITRTQHHRDAQEPSHALAELNDGRGTQFDPLVVAVLARIRPDIAGVVRTAGKGASDDGDSLARTFALADDRHDREPEDSPVPQERCCCYCAVGLFGWCVSLSALPCVADRGEEGLRMEAPPRESHLVTPPAPAQAPDSASPSSAVGKGHPLAIWLLVLVAFGGILLLLWAIMDLRWNR